PETAVALGAHLVPRNGVAYRPAPPVSQPQAPSHQQQTHQPFQQLGPQSGPQPVSQPFQQQSFPRQYPGAGDFMAGAQFPQVPAAGAAPVRKGASKATLVAAGAIVVVALLVLGGFLIFGQKSFPSAADCTGQPGSPDDKGFTSCLRQLAGPVAD